ncbi:nucleoside triphosphate pyrophosphohydrolase [bacterium]|nr:nucleoside triphosphate pyrophosphohydrolase [bacterium]
MRALREVMRLLREPGGCPWDRAQTHESLRPYLLEEAYEALEAVDQGDLDGLREELGDILLQIVFHSRIAEEENRWELADVIRGIREKMIRRHPHVFGDMALETPDEVRDEWEKIKLRDKGNGGEQKKTLGGVPKTLPALTRAFRVQEKMAGVGFDWPDASGALDKLREEMEETIEAVMSGDKRHAEEEIGDLLFSAVNAARLSGFSAEEALRRSTEKVMGRFEQVEAQAASEGHLLSDLTLEEMDAIWDRVKQAEHEAKAREQKSGAGS